MTLVFNDSPVIRVAHGHDVRVISCRHCGQNGYIENIARPGVIGEGKVSTFKHPPPGIVNVIMGNGSAVRAANVSRLPQVVDLVLVDQ